jgi:hypothetical protein
MHIYKYMHTRQASVSQQPSQEATTSISHLIATAKAQIASLKPLMHTLNVPAAPTVATAQPAVADAREPITAQSKVVYDILSKSLEQANSRDETDSLVDSFGSGPMLAGAGAAGEETETTSQRMVDRHAAAQDLMSALKDRERQLRQAQEELNGHV